jgi:hypothetical protein
MKRLKPEFGYMKKDVLDQALGEIYCILCALLEERLFPYDKEIHPEGLVIKESRVCVLLELCKEGVEKLEVAGYTIPILPCREPTMNQLLTTYDNSIDSLIEGSYGVLTDLRHLIERDVNIQERLIRLWPSGRVPRVYLSKNTELFGGDAYCSLKECPTGGCSLTERVPLGIHSYVKAGEE